MYAAHTEGRSRRGGTDGRQAEDLYEYLARHGRESLLANDILFIGDGAGTYRELIVATLGQAARIHDPAAPPLAGIIAMLATIEYKNGHRPPPHAIRPLYVRRPDVEIVREGVTDRLLRLPLTARE